jgi:hypothetical protein
MENPTTPDVTPQTRDTFLKELTNQVADALLASENTIGVIREIRASLAIDGPLLKAEPQYTKEQLAKMLRDAYNLGATAHEENMMVPTTGWAGGVEVRVEMEEGGFSFNGEVEVDADVIKEAVEFENHNMTDEQVEEILNA